MLVRLLGAEEIMTSFVKNDKTKVVSYYRTFNVNVDLDYCFP